MPPFQKEILYKTEERTLTVYHILSLAVNVLIVRAYDYGILDFWCCFISVRCRAFSVDLAKDEGERAHGDGER